jgi:hypothetical protein
MVTWPSLVMLSLGGLLGSSISTPFRLDGFVQYFSNMPSLIHLFRDRERDSARTPLGVRVSKRTTGRVDCHRAWCRITKPFWN